jgi:hypothetical protein
MSTEKYNYLQLIKSNQWASRVFINGNPITITIKEIFNKDGEEFVKFVDQNNEQRTILSNLIEIPTFTME